MKKSLFLALSVVLCGCISSGVRPRQYLLDAQTEAPAQPLPLVTMGRSAFPGGEIRLPRYLDSATPMMRGAKSQVSAVDERARWASPLPDMMREVLALNLIALAAPDAGAVASVDQLWFSRFAPENRQSIQVAGVARLSLTSGGNLTVRFDFEQEWDGKSVDSLVIAYNQALKRLALLLAQRISQPSSADH
ncbi:MAG: membrane integrity-associated transporter subunit PqiC [Victivallales bacterium]|nr:membrane integrity-associated transporter subunit PqiC [Victivallales bacterium]